MTRRQLNLGCTNEDVLHVKRGEIMRSYETCVAWLATVKKGEYYGKEVCRMMIEACDKAIPFKPLLTMDERVDIIFELFQRYLRAMSINIPEFISYTNTYGLDILRIK